MASAWKRAVRQHALDRELAAGDEPLDEDLVPRRAGAARGPRAAPAERATRSNAAAHSAGVSARITPRLPDSAGRLDHARDTTTRGSPANSAAGRVAGTTTNQGAADRPPETLRARAACWSRRPRHEADGLAAPGRPSRRAASRRDGRRPPARRRTARSRAAASDLAAPTPPRRGSAPASPGPATGSSSA